MAALLRLYRIDTTEFDPDQANIFRMAHDALVQGHLVATSNIASIGIYNPPATIYLLMLAALFSPNPLSGALLNALLAILAVLMTYIFLRLSYGRLVATIAAATYATARDAVNYSRFMWNQNFLLLFVTLFMAVLFWGVVARRKGWLAPALLLLGWCIQLHGTGVLLAVPLAAALLLAPWKTLHWRDLLLGAVGWLVIYAPYLIWWVYSDFLDLQYLRTHHVTQATVFNNEPLLMYRYLWSPYGDNLSNTHAVIYPYVSLFQWLGGTLTDLVVAGIVFVLLWALWSHGVLRAWRGNWQKPWLALWGYGKAWWLSLRASPTRCGLIVLLAWQLPVLLLLHRSLTLYNQYFIVYLPGPFIFIGLLLANISEWFRRRGGWGQLARFLVYSMSIIVVVALFLTTAAYVFDFSHGNISDGGTYHHLNSLQDAVQAADQLAQQRHLSRLYMSADSNTLPSLSYLAQSTHTPAAVFNTACFMLPTAADGPAVWLVPPYNSATDAFATHFAHATLVETTPQLGGTDSSYHIYIVDPLASRSRTSQVLSQDLNFVGAQSFTSQGASWIATRWSFQRSEQPDYRTTYNYQLASAAAHGASVTCTATATRAGDQLVVPFQKTSASLVVSVTTYASRPFVIVPRLLRPFDIRFDTFMNVDDKHQVLLTKQGKDHITV